jgi:GT2 family glycosyltransferase
VGGFDETFFLYSEETDLQRRIRKAGWEIHWVPDALVTHVGGGSGGSRRAEVKEWFFQGVDRYFLKHYGRGGALMLRVATVFGACLRWMAAVLLSRGERRREASWILRRQAFSPFPARHIRSCVGEALG